MRKKNNQNHNFQKKISQIKNSHIQKRITDSRSKKKTFLFQNFVKMKTKNNKRKKYFSCLINENKRKNVP